MELCSVVSNNLMNSIGTSREEEKARGDFNVKGADNLNYSSINSSR